MVVLICNAGIMMLPKLEQIRGVEKQFATNPLEHSLLVNRLLARVKAAPSGARCHVIEHGTCVRTQGRHRV
jgi:NAD(P)-dependent dehydrogenase (short-subunit alcohol dehydrogenase family)